MSVAVFFQPGKDGFKPCVDIHYFDECVRLFFKPWSWGYWFHRWGVYCYGVGLVGVMFWSAKESPVKERT